MGTNSFSDLSTTRKGPTVVYKSRKPRKAHCNVLSGLPDPQRRGLVSELGWAALSPSSSAPPPPPPADPSRSRAAFLLRPPRTTSPGPALPFLDLLAGARFQRVRGQSVLSVRNPSFPLLRGDPSFFRQPIVYFPRCFCSRAELI